MRLSKPPGIALAWVAALAVAMTGCGESGSAERGDSLDLGQTPGTACVFGSNTGRGTFGTHVENVGGEVVELLDVHLVDPVGVMLVGTSVVPVASSDDGLGAAHGWPPDVGSTPGSWSDQSPVADFKLGDDEVVEIWVGLETTRNQGSAKSLEIEYRTPSGEVFVQRTMDRLVVTAEDECD